jgi:hypothetical protein
MTKLAWGSHGERFFETGIDRGVLYLPGQDGVPWNGLKAVNEAPSGGEPVPYYIDGFKYLNVATAEEFKATLDAFSSPNEFARCDGRQSIQNGLFATQQPRLPFNLSYRTLVGNDIKGTEHGYKIHLVYNALAAPAQRSNQTAGNTTTPLALSWGITTTPPKMTGLKPTAHLVIDSRLTPPNLMTVIEDILYGSDDVNPTLPSVDELMELFKSTGPVVRKNTLTVPRPEVYAGSGWSSAVGLQTIPEAGWVGGVLASTIVPYIFTDVSEEAYLAGDRITLSVRYRVPATAGGASFVSVVPHLRASNTYYRDGTHVNRVITLGQDEIVTIAWTTPVDIAAGDLDLAIIASNSAGTDSVTAASGFAMRATDVLIEPGWTIGTYLDGNTPDTNTETYDWLGLVGASQSVMKSWY